MSVKAYTYRSRFKKFASNNLRRVFLCTPFFFQLHKPILFYCLPHLPHKVKEEVDVMDGGQAKGREFVGAEEVVEVGAGVVSARLRSFGASARQAGGAGTDRVNRLSAFREFCVCYVKAKFVFC